MNKVFLAHLEKLACAATPGPWLADEDSDGEVYDEDRHKLVCQTHRHPIGGNAAYIAAASPDVVLRLIKQLNTRALIVGHSLESGSKVEVVQREDDIVLVVSVTDPSTGSRRSLGVPVSVDQLLGFANNVISQLAASGVGSRNGASR